MNHERIRIHKLDSLGREVWSYEGRVMHRSGTSITCMAVFDRDMIQVGKVTFERGDIFEEIFYSDRWYNIFRVSHPRTGAVKGWYCNITRPAVIAEDSIRAEDLALDLLVYPDGDWEVLDEEEYRELALQPSEREQVDAAIKELLQLAASGTPPFDYQREAWKSLPEKAGTGQQQDSEHAQ